MEQYHSLLKKQIKRHIKDIDKLPDDVVNLLNYISEAYRNFDDDRKMLERSLELSSEELLTANLELRALFQSLPDIIFVVEMNGKILDCKGGVQSNLILPRDNYKGKNILSYFDKNIRVKFQECFENAYRNEKNTVMEYSLVLNDKKRFFEASFLNLGGKQIIVVIKDLTERIKTEETLRKNYLQITKKNIFESIINTVSQSVHNSLNISDIIELAVEAVYNRIDAVDFVAIYEIDGTIARLKSHRGYPDWFIKKVKEIDFPKGDTWHCIDKNATILVNNIKEDKHLGPAAKEVGTNSYISSPITIHGNPIGCIQIHSKKESAFDNDEVFFVESLSGQIANAINTSLQAMALKESEQRYRTLFDQSPVGIFIIDKDLKISHCNQSMIDIFQSDFDKVIGLDLNNLQDKAFIPVVKRALQGEVNSHETYYQATTSSAKLWLNARFVPLYNISNKDVVGVIGVVEDITERRNAENKLKDSEEIYRGIVENSSDLIIQTTYDGKFVYISPNSKEIVGYEPEELIGTSIFEKIHPDDLANAIKEFSSAIKEMRPGTLTVRSKHKNGEWRWLDTNGKPYKTALGEIKAVITSHDITQKKLQEEESIKSQKLDSLSVLAGGIAHDFNNLLTIVISNLSLAEMYLEGNSQVTDIISSAQRASLRASDLTNQLRTFAKGSSLIKKQIFLNKFLKESVLFALTGSNVSHEFNFREDSPVKIDEGQINQVINNLVINATQAMPNGGEIKVTTDKVSIEEQKNLGWTQGDYIKISILDEGVGIPDEDLNKIFDPYFTTKEKGAGLGLATSYSIIQKHGGFITVDSTLGKGTQFDIYLPTHYEEVCSKESLVASSELKGNGRLLLMDDEEDIRLSVSKMLNLVGYEVDCVENGEEAIRAYNEAISKDNLYDAVILDLTVPGGMGGVETVRKLKEINPEVFCIVSSGYSAGPVIEQYINYGFDAYLNKPFSVKDLKEVLSKIEMSQRN